MYWSKKQLKLMRRREKLFKKKKKKKHVHDITYIHKTI